MKDSKYFFRLWGLNLKGHFTFLGRLAKSNPIISYPLSVLVFGPITCLSPFSSLIKTTIDFVSRKELPETKKNDLKIMKKALDKMNSTDNSDDIDDLLRQVGSYKKKFICSTISDSTQKLLTDLDGYKPKKEQGKNEPVETNAWEQQGQPELVKRAILNYICDDNNIGKGMYRHIAVIASKKSVAYCSRYGLHSNVTKEIALAKFGKETTEPAETGTQNIFYH